MEYVVIIDRGIGRIWVTASIASYNRGDEFHGGYCNGIVHSTSWSKAEAFKSARALQRVVNLEVFGTVAED
jgi:hypothetical protein